LRVRGFVDSLARQPGAAARVDFSAVRAAVKRWLAAGTALDAAERAALALPEGAARTRSLAAMNLALRAVEQELLFADGIPGRPWFRHALYAPRPTYAAMTLPGIQEAVDKKNWTLAGAQAAALAARLDAAARMVERATAAAAR
jgi:N-acetylated-alpha-linked acidic dipeptidase